MENVIMIFSISNGVIDLLGSANRAEAPCVYTFYVSGDLNQMSIQKSFLINHAIDVGQRDVHPVLKECDVLQALTLIYTNKVEGWWHYQEQYIKYSICTKEEFHNALERQCSR
jgi:hypothetical protein